MQEVDEEQLELVFTALTKRRRRIALSCLQNHPTIALADLAESVAEGERHEDASDIDRSRILEIYMSLYHTDIPLFAEANLARYDQATDHVRRTRLAPSIIEDVCHRVNAIISGELH